MPDNNVEKQRIDNDQGTSRPAEAQNRFGILPKDQDNTTDIQYVDNEVGRCKDVDEKNGQQADGTQVLHVGGFYH